MEWNGMESNGLFAKRLMAIAALMVTMRLILFHYLDEVILTTAE
jgi:hypothetical protein